MGDVAPRAFDEAGDMGRLLALLDDVGIGNGWAKREPSLYPTPKKTFVPARWRFSQALAALRAAGRFVNTELAERRNLILKNPISGNEYPTVTTLVAAYQMVKAGETARSHRHTSNALRLVLEGGPDVFTIVDGVKIPMQRNDVLLTPNWSWHGHANEAATDAYWIDVLDVPLTQLLGPVFLEHHEERVEHAERIAPDSPCRFAFSDVTRRLDAEPERSAGRRSVALGAPALSSIALEVTRLEAGATFEEPASTLNCIYACMDGEGEAVVDGHAFAIARGDVVAAPSSCAQTFRAAKRLHLLRASDEPLLAFLGWLRPIDATR